MQATCEVVGWLDDADKTHVLVREKNGRISQQAAKLESAFWQQAIQTGRFRCGEPIIDPVTRETVGYEIETVSSGTPIERPRSPPSSTP